jgi:hypothetical protein
MIRGKEIHRGIKNYPQVKKGISKDLKKANATRQLPEPTNGKTSA